MPLDALIELTHAGGSEVLEADAVDLGFGGLSLRASFMPPVGARMQCSFSCPPVGERVVADCEVVWSAWEGPQAGTFGVRFVSLDTRSATLIRRALEPVAGAQSAPRAPRRRRLPGKVATVASLTIDGLGAPIEAELQRDQGDHVQVVQALDFLRLGRGVQVDVGGGAGRPGRIASVELQAGDGGVPRLSLGILLDAPGPTLRAVAPPASARAERAARLLAADPGDPTASGAAAPWPVPGEREAWPEGAPFGLAASIVPVDSGAEAQALEADEVAAPDARADEVWSELARESDAEDAWMDTLVPGPDAALPPQAELRSETESEASSASPVEVARVVEVGVPVGNVVTDLSELQAEAEADEWEDGLDDADALDADPGEPATLPAPVGPGTGDAEVADATRETGAGAAPTEDALELPTASLASALSARLSSERLREVPGLLRAIVAGWVARARARLGERVPASRELLTEVRQRLRVVWSSQVGRLRHFRRAQRKRRTTAPAPRTRRAGGAESRRGRARGDGAVPARAGRLVLIAVLAFGGVAAAVYALWPRKSPDVLELHRTVAPVAMPGEGAPAASSQPTEAAPALAPAPKQPAEPAPREADAESDAPLDPRKVFGAAEVPNGRSYSLRMNGPIARIAGTAREGGFSVRVPKRLSLDRASPIATSHPALSRSLVLNQGDSAELTIDFVRGKQPAYRVEARGNLLEITVERM